MNAYSAITISRRNVVIDNRTGKTVDMLRTASGAEHAAHMLNVGACTIDHHATIGCRVVATPPATTHKPAETGAQWAIKAYSNHLDTLASIGRLA